MLSGYLDSSGPHAVHHLVDSLRLPFVPWLENDRQQAAGLIGPYAGAGTRDVQHVLYVRFRRQESHGPVRHLPGAFDGCPFGQFQFHGEVTLIFLRHETAGHESVHHPDADHDDSESGKHTPRVFQRRADHTTVEAVACGQSEINPPEETVFAAGARFQEKRTHDRAERQRHDRGDHYRYGDRDRELAVELSRDPGQEAYRHENGAEYQRHGDERPSQILHRFFCRFARGKVLFVHDAVHVLHHHDGVVHHDADGQNQSQQRQHIQREPEKHHHAEGADQRDRHGHNGNDRCAPALQREVNDQNHQQQGLEQRAVNVMDRLRNIRGHVERDVVGDALGKTQADLFHRLPDRFGDLHGVRSRQHVDVQYGGVPAVYAALGIVGRGFERDTRYVAQPDDRAVRIRPDYDLLELTDRRKTALSGDGDRDVHAFHRRLSQHAGG